MKRESLDNYDVYPEAMINYLRYNGRHFNRKLFEFAVEQMTTGKDKHKIKPMTKQEVDELLKVYGVKLENNTLYDYVYVANMCKADFLGSSVPDEGHLCKYVKDVIDDVDAYDGIVFNRWYADMCRSGVPIDWEEMIKQ